jgi:UDP-glucose 4-epimerase
MAKKVCDIKKVVVTGAAGTVGSYLVDELLEKGYQVRGVDIRAPREPGRAKMEFIEGDLTDPGFAASVVQGMDAVINTAALVDISLSYEELYPLNVEAVRVLYQKAAEAGARKFVHFSSGSIYGKPEGELLTEDTELSPSSPYEQSKVDSEKLLAEISQDEGLDWIVLRPGLIYGPGARFLLADIAAIPPLLRFVLGKNIPALRGSIRTNVVHAEDVARAAVFLMRNAAPARAYNVADPTPLDVGTIVTAAIRAYGLETRFTIPLPEPGTLRPFKPILDSDIFFRTANKPLAPIWKELVEEHGLVPGLNPTLDRETAPYMFRHSVFSVDRLRVRGFRWKHPDVRESMPAVIRWYVENGWIPKLADVRPGAGRTPRLGFSFTETMAGHVKLTNDAIMTPTDAGRPFEFTVTARATRVERFLRNAETRIEGILHWDDMADGAAISGTLRIPLITDRKLHYDFSFTAMDGKKYRFVGQKDVKLLKPLSTMTTLPGRILDSDEHEVAAGVARFDLRRELLPMVRSFSLL